jgi:hypothetical protein
MIKCPRCNLPQEKSPECRYCGLIFEEFLESARKVRAARRRRTAVLFAMVAAAAGVLLSSYWVVSSRHPAGAISTPPERTTINSKGTEDDDLKQTAKELTGDAGILNSIVHGSTNGGIISMVAFSIIGIGYFTYGKKSQQLSMVICGIALMVYSYFVTGTAYIILVGAGLSALPFIFGRR